MPLFLRELSAILVQLFAVRLRLFQWLSGAVLAYLVANPNFRFVGLRRSRG